MRLLYTTLMALARLVPALPAMDADPEEWKAECLEGCSSLSESSEGSIEAGRPMLRLRLDSSAASSILHRDDRDGDDDDKDNEEEEAKVAVGLIILFPLAV